MKRAVRTVCAALVCVAAVLFAWEAVSGRITQEIDGKCEFHFIDVGQGDCSMFITDGAAVAVDAGTSESSASLAAYISGYTDTLDYLILTHPHEDHIGGAAAIINTVDVKCVLLTDASTDTYTFTRLLDAIEEKEIAVKQAAAGDVISAGDMDITVLAPLGEFDNYNNYSMVVRIDYGNVSALVTGDAEKASENLMLEKWGEKELSADVLKLGHHGSSTSTGKRFLDAVSPSWAVISCGEDNSYGHPHRETLALLDDFGIPYVRTDKTGTAVFVTDGKSIALKDSSDPQ